MSELTTLQRCAKRSSLPDKFPTYIHPPPVVQAAAESQDLLMDIWTPSHTGIDRLEV